MGILGDMMGTIGELMKRLGSLPGINALLVDIAKIHDIVDDPRGADTKVPEE